MHMLRKEMQYHIKYFCLCKYCTLSIIFLIIHSLDPSALLQSIHLYSEDVVNSLTLGAPSPQSKPLFGLVWAVLNIPPKRFI